MHKKQLVGLLVCTAFIGIGSGSALAAKGDGPQGKVEQGNGVSICIFSGLNDSPDDPMEGGQVQSYGQVVKVVGVAALKEAGETPAALCNPHSGIPTYWRTVPNGPKD
jgi:hypothetical protein